MSAEETGGSGLRVAMVGLRAPWGTDGGVETAVGALAPRLVDLGCRVRVFCRPRHNPLGSGLHRGVELVDVPTVQARGAEAFVHTALSMPRALDADLVHVHATGPALFSWLPRLAGRATVVTVHGLDWEREKWGPLARTVLRAGAWSSARFPHELIVVGRHLQGHFRETYGVESTWVPNGVEPIAPRPLERGEVPGLQPGAYGVFVGRLVPEKGLERLVSAWAEAGLELPLVVVGGDQHSEAHARSLREGAPASVRFVGSRRGEARDALLTHARAFLSASRLEGFPLAPLEAMAAGRPVVLSDIPPHRELLEGAPGAGWLVPEGGWPQALRRLAEAAPEDLQAMGALGKAHVARRFSWDRVAERTLSVYRAALLARDGGTRAR